MIVEQASQPLLLHLQIIITWRTVLPTGGKKPLIAVNLPFRNVTFSGNGRSGFSGHDYREDPGLQVIDGVAYHGW